MVANTKWDTKELGIDNSPYVDFLLKEFKAFAAKFDRESKQHSSIITNQVKQLIWQHAIKYAMEELVEGYSRAKKVEITENGILIFL